MTAPTHHKDFKICPVCEKRFYRRLGKSPSHFRAQITCSRSCGNVHSADPFAHPPKPEPEMPRPVTVTDQRWRDQAACLSPYVDNEIFFALSNDWKGRPDQAKIDEAKAVCEGCPVRAACLAEAIAEKDAFAIRGGLTPDERRPMVRKLARAS